MDDSLCLRTLYAVGIDVGHDVVADHLLPLLCHVIVDIVRMAFQFLDLLVRDI